MVAISLFIVSIGVLAAIQGNTSILGGQSESQANRAQFLAEAGIQDGAIKVARNKSYSGTYTLSEVDGSVAVSVSGSAPVVIIATSTVSQSGSTVKRTIRAEVTLDADGKITNVTKTNL